MAFCAMLDAWGGPFRRLFNQECALQPAHQDATAKADFQLSKNAVAAFVKIPF